MLNRDLLLDKGKTIVKLFDLAYIKRPTQQIIPSGISLFDKAMDGGFREGELIVISGETGQGKTTFAQTLTCNFNKQGVQNLWFSYEMQPYYLADKFKQMGQTRKDPIYTPFDLVNGTIEFIEQEIKEATEDEWIQCKAVFIDHLHYLIPLGATFNNSSLAIGAIVRGIKQLAVKYNIVIFLIAHTKKIYQDEELDLSSVRDSSLVCQEADYVYLVKREKVEKEFLPKKKRSEMNPMDIDKPKTPSYGSDWLPTTIVKLAKNRRLGQMINLRFNFLNGVLSQETSIYEEKDAIQDDTVI